ncbi:MAG: hypothetical protein Fur0041_01490 [Bacteroidia bacterium]
MMRYRLKIITLFILLFFTCSLFGQNGTSVIHMPGFFSPLVLRYKNDIRVDNNGRVWIALRDNGIIKWDGTSWSFYDLNSGLPDYNIRCITFTPDGRTWAGTDTGGVAVFNGLNWTTYNTYNSALPSGKIFCLHENGNDIWAGTDKGLALLSGNTWTVYNRQNSGLPGDSVYSIDINLNGDVVAATNRGLVTFDGSSWSNYWQGATVTSGVSFIYIHNDGTQWTNSNGKIWTNKFGNWDTLAAHLKLPAIKWINPKMIGEGLSGGVAFITVNGQMNEVLNDRVLTYYPYGVVNNGSAGLSYFTKAQSGNSLWIINSHFSTTSPNIDLLEFNPQNYSGNGLGLTGDNCKLLDVNNIETIILNIGDNFWDTENTGYYRVPKSTQNRTIFCQGTWMGGLDSGNILHQAAMTYRQSKQDFYPGPIDINTQQTDSLTSYRFDRIWKLDKYQISVFQWQFAQGNVQSGLYTPPSDLTDWPAKGNYNISNDLAPFVDVNQNGIYDPLTGGDYPVIKGDQELFCVYNDIFGPHTETGSKKLGVEIQFRAYAFLCNNVNDSDRVINYTTFYEYNIINRSDTAYHDFYFGSMYDTDLGDYTDDYAGSVPQSNAVFTFNGDNFDATANGIPGYGNYPPVQSFVILDGPFAEPNDSIDNNNNGTVDEPGEKSLLTNSMSWSFNATSFSGYPQNEMHFYNYLRSIWKDNTHLTYSGNGHGGNQNVNHIFNGLPYDTAAWSEITEGITPFDRVLLMGSGPMNIAPGDTLHYTIGAITSSDSSLTWNDTAYYQMFLNDIAKTQSWYDNQSMPSCMPLYDNINSLESPDLNLFVFPNPANEKITVRTNNFSNDAVIEIFDLNGKRMFAGVWNLSDSMTIPVTQFPSGLYMIRISDGKISATKKFIKY